MSFVQLGSAGVRSLHCWRSHVMAVWLASAQSTKQHCVKRTGTKRHTCVHRSFTRSCSLSLIPCLALRKAVPSSPLIWQEMKRSGMTLMTPSERCGVCPCCCGNTSEASLCFAVCLVGQVGGKCTQLLRSIPADISSQGPPSWAFNAPSLQSASESFKSVTFSCFPIHFPSSSPLCCSLLSFLPLPTTHAVLFPLSHYDPIFISPLSLFV